MYFRNGCTCSILAKAAIGKLALGLNDKPLILHQMAYLGPFHMRSIYGSVPKIAILMVHDFTLIYFVDLKACFSLLSRSGVTFHYILLSFFRRFLLMPRSHQSLKSLLLSIMPRKRHIHIRKNRPRKKIRNQTWNWT